MTSLTILSSTQLDRLRRELEGSISGLGTADRIHLPEATQLLRTTISVSDPPQLVVDPEHRTAADAENAVRIHNWLPDLDHTQAADPRLWTTLALREFWGYMQKRWEIPSGATSLSRHFMRGGREDLNRHGIARLWWGAELTYAPWTHDRQLAFLRNADPARFTRIFFAQQQRSVDLMERCLGSGRVLRTCILDVLDELAPQLSNKDAHSRALAVELNQLLQTQQLESRPAKEVRETILGVARAVAEDLKAEKTVT